jgi:hypothetical protein
LIRTALFIFFASAIWALLPLTAQSDLHHRIAPWGRPDLAVRLTGFRRAGA